MRQEKPSSNSESLVIFQRGIYQRLALETDIQEKNDKASKNGQNRARNGKDKVKSKPKSVKVKSQPSEENTT
ncbi:hypothetical protein Tco_1148920 [Tanacetum coccineum]